MKFLKLFESKYYDEFEKIKQITGVNEIEDDIKDTIQELSDDIDFYRFQNLQTLLQLTYQRKLKRTTTIGLDYYQKIVDENNRKFDLNKENLVSLIEELDEDSWTSATKNKQECAKCRLRVSKFCTYW
jgi:heme oxygenase